MTVLSCSEQMTVFPPLADGRERFIDSREVRRQWLAKERIWVVVRKRDPLNPRALFSDPSLSYHVIAETQGRRLISNQR